MSKLIKAVVKHTALLHNGVRYEVGGEIELTEQEAQSLAYYLEVTGEVEKVEKKTVETTETVEQSAAEVEQPAAEADQPAKPSRVKK
ncbi:hypothetical protein A1D23_03480 [Chelonobacter oris]|uniref:hypothetical protein n=1 Tax=Chelonobacter oris TaxID=505317 RepID=UPI00244CDB90|nr:hypothetical protein [Chelonobacter oris]MDH2999167.1 hypothetical protein [Chelonobacter oris]